MASLCELLQALHEIQNPLNFVNNFLVSNELIDEMKENLKKGITKKLMQLLKK
jgi:hypothetical protein